MTQIGMIYADLNYFYINGAVREPPLRTSGKYLTFKI